RGRGATSEAVARFGWGEGAAGSGIERRAIRVASSVRRERDLRAAAKTGVDQAAPVKAGERRRIVFAVLALSARRRKAKSEPGEVVDNGGFEMRLGARPVQIFDAQQDAPLRLRGEALVDERGIGVTEMEPPVRRGREAQN